MSDRLKPVDLKGVVDRSVEEFDVEVRLSTNPETSFAQLMRQKAKIPGIGLLIRHVQGQFPPQAHRSREAAYEASLILFVLLEETEC